MWKECLWNFGWCSYDVWTWWGPAKGKSKGNKSKGKGKGKDKTQPADKWDIMRTWPNHYLQVGGLQEPITVVASELVCDWDPPLWDWAAKHTDRVWQARKKQIMLYKRRFFVDDANEAAHTHNRNAACSGI